MDFVPVPNPTRKTSTHTRPIPAGTGRVPVYPRVRVDPHTSTLLPSRNFARRHRRLAGTHFVLKEKLQNNGRRSRGDGGQVPQNLERGIVPPDFVILQNFKHQITYITM